MKIEINGCSFDTFSLGLFTAYGEDDNGAFSCFL